MSSSPLKKIGEDAALPLRARARSSCQLPGAPVARSSVSFFFTTFLILASLVQRHFKEYRMPETIVHHRGVLPHHQEAGQIISLTWRLAFTLPVPLKALLEEMRQLSPNGCSASNAEEKYTEAVHRNAILMQSYDDHLGKYELAGFDLCQMPQAGIVIDSVNFYAGSLYELHAWCLMPNHLHLLLKPLPGQQGKFARLPDIVRKLKSYTAKEINFALGRSGPLWQHEYFDRYIRDNADYYRTVNYFLQNPVKAGLVKKSEDWLYLYYQPGLIEEIKRESKS